MEKKVLLNDLVGRGTHIRTEVTPKVVIADGSHPKGEIWDANKVVSAISQDNQLDESKFQAKLVSGTNIKTVAGQSILGEGNINIQATVKANEPFPSSWDIHHTMSDLIDDINADENVIPGKIYLSTVYLTDLPASMSQAEMKVEIMGYQAGEFIMVFSVSSANTSPYKWEYSSYNEVHGPWRSWVPSTVQIPTIPADVSYFNNDAGYLTSHQSLSNYYTKSEVEGLIAAAIASLTPSEPSEPGQE